MLEVKVDITTKKGQHEMIGIDMKEKIKDIQDHGVEARGVEVQGTEAQGMIEEEEVA